MDIIIEFVNRMQKCYFLPKANKLTKSTIEHKKLSTFLLDIELLITNSSKDRGFIANNTHLSDNIQLIVEEKKNLNKKLNMVKKEYEFLLRYVIYKL